MRRRNDVDDKVREKEGGGGGDSSSTKLLVWVGFASSEARDLDDVTTLCKLYRSRVRIQIQNSELEWSNRRDGRRWHFTTCM